MKPRRQLRRVKRPTIPRRDIAPLRMKESADTPQKKSNLLFRLCFRIDSVREHAVF